MNSVKFSKQHYLIKENKGLINIELNEKNLFDNFKKRGSIIINSSVKTAETLVNKAEKEAYLIIEQAKGKAEKIKNQAFYKGYGEGFEQAKKEVDKEFTFLKEEMKKVISQTIEEAKKLTSDREKDMIELALSIAEKVIQCEVTSNKDIIFQQVKIALEKLNDRTNITIRISKADYNKLNEYRERLISLQDDIKELNIIQDIRVDQGGCIVESSSGTVDGRLNYQLAEIKKCISEALESE